MNTRPHITQTPVAPRAGCLISTNKTKIQTQSSADRSTTSLVFCTNLTLCKAYTNHWTNLRREETKRKKEFNPEAWKKKTSNTVRLKKKKAEEKQINTTKMKEQTTNTEVQINEEEIGKLLKKNSE